MNKGYIKSVKSAGYGFIVYRGIDFYFHKTAFNGDWKKLTAEFASTPAEKKIEVEFEVDAEHKDAPKAKSVKLV